MWRIFSRRKRDSDLDDEFAAHLALEERQLMERGVPRGLAGIEARRLFGNRALIQEDTRAVRGFGVLERFWQDLRYAGRVLRRAPAFTVAAVLSLALGIGATTSVFSIADTVFLRPLPYPDANRLVWISVHFPGIGGEFVLSPDYVAWRHDNRTFEQLGATRASFSGTELLGGTEPAEVQTAHVSANFLQTFGVTPQAGRTFRPDEELPNGPKAVLLTDPFWRDHFHGRRDILGSVITLDGIPHVIIGILPKSFIFPMDVKVDLLSTLPVSPAASHRDRSMSTWAVYGRLKRGVTMAQARADLDRLLDASRADAPQIYRKENTIVLQTLQEHRAGNARLLVLILLGAAGCLLAIACSNVANLLLARWSARQRELVIRAAIGAARGRLTRQMFVEIALLIAMGTAVGMAFVTVALRGFVHFAAGELPRLSEAGINFRVFAIALLVSIATALFFGGLPALRAGRLELHSALQHGSRASTGGRPVLRRILVAAEVAFTIVLLSGAGLLFQTLWHLRNDRLGFQPEHLLTVSIPLTRAGYRGPARDALASAILTDLNRMPGKEAVSLAECSPLSSGNRSGTFSRSDRPLPEPYHRGDSIGLCGADAEYLHATGTRLVRGRFFTEDDYHHPGMLAVLNEAAAQAYFPGEDPVGRQILGASPWKTVVGVVADTKNHELNQPATPEAWIDDLSDQMSSNLLFLVRTTAAESAVAGTLRASHPNVYSKLEAIDEDIAQRTASPRFNTLLLSAFAALALLMAIVGVYGVLAFSVAQRRTEIGIRVAMGATPRSVLSMVLKESAATLIGGAAVGLAAALVLTRYLSSLLYGVTARDPGTYAAVLGTLAIAATVASLVPALRASKIDPATMLRHE